VWRCNNIRKFLLIQDSRSQHWIVYHLASCPCKMPVIGQGCR
jgi:hypothetical protein